MNALTTIDTRTTDNHTEPRRLPMGIAMLKGGVCQYGRRAEQIGPDDLVVVDFDRRQIDRDGLYLLEQVRGGAVTWYGCARVQKCPGLRIDWQGEGNWEDLDLQKLDLQVVGLVIQVMTPKHLH